MHDSYKKAVRDTLKKTRTNTSIHFRSTVSNQICKKINALEAYRRGKKIALYFAINGEVDLTLLWQSAPLHGKHCYFPILNDDLTLSFLPATPATQFKVNRFGIKEPDVNIAYAVCPEELDLIIMPLVAFDINCTRIGMGLGSYDRTLANKENLMLLGVAYQFQRVNYIHPLQWDVPLNGVVTEKATYWKKNSFGNLA